MTKEARASHTTRRGRDLASALERLAARCAAEPGVQLGRLLASLGTGAFGLAILILALPNAVPGPPMPGMSTVLGIPIMLLAIQLALGARRPSLPPGLARRTLPGPALATVLGRAAALFRRLGPAVRPRLVRFTGLAARRIAAVLLVLLALVLALPIPLGNLPPAWAIVLLSLALAARDGGLMLAGAALGVLALLWNAGVVVALAIAGEAALDSLGEGWLPFGAAAEGG